MRHKPQAISGGTLIATPDGTHYAGTDGTQLLLRGVQCHVSRWCVLPRTAYQLCGHIFISRRWARTTFDLTLLTHEYGHFLQQRELGLWRYLWRVALRSTFSVLRNRGQHFAQPYERDATRRGRQYLLDHQYLAG